MIRQITAEETLPIRAVALRDNWPLDECRVPQDNDPDGFHLGYFSEEETLVAVASFYPQLLEDIEGKGYRLRQMGVLQEHRRKRIGQQLVEAGERILQQERKADYLWFDARLVAFAFYQSLGFKFISDEYHVPRVGPHRRMAKTFTENAVLPSSF